MKEALSEIWNMPKEEFMIDLEKGLLLGIGISACWIVGIVVLASFNSRKK